MDHYVLALDSTEKQFQFRCFVFTWPIPFTFSYDSANLVSMFSLWYFRFESLCLRSFVLSFQRQTRCEWMESLVRISMNKVFLSIQVYKRIGAVFVTVIQQQHETIAGRFLWSIKQLTQVSCCASETLITSSWTCLGLLATFLFAFFFCFSVFVSGNGRSFIAVYSW